MPKPRRPYRLVAFVAVFIGVGCLGVAAVGLMGYFGATRTGDVMPDTTVITSDAPQPDEIRPLAIQSSYTVPADQPRVVVIPRLDIESYVQPVSVTSSGAMATPTNIHYVGWYTDSVAPGEPGVSIVNGHYTGRYDKGVFWRLGELVKGDEIRLQMGDLSWRLFVVESNTMYDTAQASAAIFDNRPTITNELHLITCGGRYDDVAQTYDKRVLVVAQLKT